jgi:8-oxo-dGTP pyrophosphatase MutT (NUDIX family)
MLDEALGATADDAAYSEDLSGDTPGPVSEQPVAAGVALCATDTGRTLFIQRALINGDPAGGLWEVPGGTLDPGEVPWEAAQREFGEEVGQPLPDGELCGTWLSPDGVYQGFCYVIDQEASLDTSQPPSVDNPDNPGGSNYTESVAWMDPAHMDRGPRLLRAEMRTGTPWAMLKAPPAGGGGNAQMASAKAIVVPIHLELDQESEELLAAAGHPGMVKLSTGWAYPITDVASLHDAQSAFGRSKPQDREKLRAHIAAKAKQLGVYDQLDDKWKGQSMAASADEFDSLVAALKAPTKALIPEEPLPGPTPFSVKDDGTADGHLALWASCHIGYPGCVKPPQEDSFDFYNLGDAVTADGRHVGVGKVTIGTGHAGADLSWRTAAAHYDNSGTTAAVAHASRDRWGIRLASVLTTEDGKHIDELRRSPLSGDWRRINGQLRLVASLGVNVPGYPIPRALVAGGDVQSMFVGFDPQDAAELVAQADSLAASLGLDAAGRAAWLRSELGLADAPSAAR